MYSTLYSRQLATHFLEEQIAILVQQNYADKYQLTSNINKSNLYTDTLSGMLLSDELNQKNLQLKEQYYFKVKMIRMELNELSQRLEKFKRSLNNYIEKLDEQEE